MVDGERLVDGGEPLGAERLVDVERLVGGRYLLREHLGSGGMGTVWRAEDVLLGRQVAVKEVVFPPGTRPEEAEVLRERTRREARSAARLDHPSAVTVYDVVEEDGRPWLVMELVEARTLAQVVTDAGPLPPREVARVGLAVLGALEAAHARGIVHRDVKPANVMLRDDGRVVLTDFGIATSAEDPSLTGSGLLLGSPAYIAPERARGEVPGPPSDLWSFGATLFTAVEGQPPFDGGSALLTVTAVVTGEHRPYAAAGPLVPVLDGLLDKDPGARLSAPQARGLLQEVADREPSQATRLLGPAAAGGGQRGGHTSALDLGEVRQEIAHVAPAPIPAPAALPAVASGRVSGPVTGPARVPVARPERVPAGPREQGPRRRGWQAPAAAAALLAAVVGGGVALSRPDSTAGTAAGPAAAPSGAPADQTPAPSAAPTAPTTSAPTSPAPSTPAPSSPAASPAAPPAAAPVGSSDAAAVPAGWRTYSGGPGWTAAVPPGWTAGTYSGNAQYRDPATGRTLRIETGTGQADAVADRQRQARSFQQKHPTYREISIAAADYRGYPAADWEFTYEGLHVLNRVFVVNGRGHSLFFQTGADDFAAARGDIAGILAAFQPAGG